MKRLMLTLLLGSSLAAAGTVTFRVTPPAGTPAGSTLTLGANFGGWNPAAEGLALSAQPDGTWTLTREFKDGDRLEFKVTRGGWDRVEKAADGSELPNRVHDVKGDATLDITVAAWADTTAPAPRVSTATGDLSTRTVELPALGVKRDLHVWLPPGYAENPGRRYPVVYLLDGQNVFDAATSFAGEWGADETGAALAAAGQPMILVALDNGGEARIAEYTVRTDARYGGGRGNAALTDLVRTVKPLIDREYRTRPEAKHTALVGSSLGGLLALYGGLKHPETFGFIGALSPSVWWGARALLDDVADLRGEGAPFVYLTTGDREGGSAADQAEQLRDTRDLDAALRARGVRSGVIVTPGAGHNEAAWAARLPGALRTFALLSGR